MFKLVRKIVMSANTAWYLYNFRQGTIREFIGAGHSVCAVCPSDEKYMDRLRELGCAVKPISISRSGKNPLIDLWTFMQYFLCYMLVRPDCVFNFTPKVNIYSTFAGKLVGARVVNNIAGLGTLFVNRSVASKFALVLYRLSQPLADFIFFQNDDDIELFANSGIRLREGRYKRIPGSGVDLNRFPYSSKRKQRTLRFLLVARMLKEKGIELYVQAAKILQERYSCLEFNLLGPIDVANPSAVSAAQIADWVGRGWVSYLGVTDDVSAVLEGVDVVVLPSYYREGVPKSLLEAAAMGKVVVTTDSVGCRETVVEGVTGFLCQPKDLESLVCVLESTIRLDSSEFELMGVNARKYMEDNFDEACVLADYKKALLG